jgi:membrane protease YdiL (CAAX protease family)
VIGLLYEYGGSLISAIIFHFLFNFLNQNMFECFKIENDNYIAYILINISIALIAGGYLLLIYLKALKKSVANN